MQTVAEFMHELFQARIAEEKAVLANRAGYRQRFIAPECRWDSQEGDLAMMESEIILSIEGSASAPMVITEYTARVHPPFAPEHHWRYHLKANGDSFLIWRVEFECLLCRGRGGAECMSCQGKHWL
jgi:hypothetical protein